MLHYIIHTAKLFNNSNDSKCNFTEISKICFALFNVVMDPLQTPRQTQTKLLSHIAIIIKHFILIYTDAIMIAVKEYILGDLKLFKL